MDKLYCCVCLHVNTGPAEEADTVINGYAVCAPHMGLVQKPMEVMKWRSSND